MFISGFWIGALLLGAAAYGRYEYRRGFNAGRAAQARAAALCYDAALEKGLYTWKVPESEIVEHANEFHREYWSDRK